MADAGLWDRFLTMCFGDAAHPEGERGRLGAPMLANWVPYRFYDARARMFVNTDSIGFVLELAPMDVALAVAKDEFFETSRIGPELQRSQSVG